MSKRIYAVAAFFAAVISTPVLAIPIAFDFSGVVTRRTINDHSNFSEDFSQQGQSFTARVVIDTGLLTSSQLSTSPGGSGLWLGTPLLPAPVDFSISVNGSALTMPVYEQNMFGVTVQDGRLPPGCSVCGVADSVSYMLRSQQAAPLVGQQLASTFSFLGYEVGSNGVSPSYVDLGVPFSADSLLTIPLPNLTLQFGSTIFDCEGLNLCFANYTNTLWFSASSVTRTDLSQVSSVPEPGTLGLIAAGLLGAGLARRRSRAA